MLQAKIGSATAGKKKRHSSTSREALILYEALGDPSRRKLLISELAEHDVNEANLLRLYQAIREFRKTEPEKRTGLGRKIVAMFAQPGGIYEVRTLSHKLKQGMLDMARFPATAFDEAYEEIATILETSERIVRTAQKIGVIHTTVLQAIKVLSTVDDEKRRLMLINELVEENLDEAVELKFFQACKDYRIENDSKKRTAMGKKIISMFVEAGSLHELAILKDATRKKLLATSKFSRTTFNEAMDEVMNSLESSPSIVQAAKRVGVVESSILSSPKGGGSTGATVISIEVFERMLNNPLLTTEFESFVRDEFIDELWKFRTAVGEWKAAWNECTTEERRQKAFEIYETMVKPGSESEINISGTMKDEIKGFLDKSLEFNLECPFDVFDKAMGEVTTMLHQNVNYRVMNAVKAAAKGAGGTSGTKEASKSVGTSSKLGFMGELASPSGRGSGSKT